MRVFGLWPCFVFFMFCLPAFADASLNSELREHARTGNIAGLAELVALGADVNSQAEFGETALYYAILFSRSRAAIWLLNHGAKPDTADDSGKTPLLRAAEHCLDDAVKALLEKSVNVNHVDENGQSALILATRSGCVRTVALLLAKTHVKLNVPDYSNRSASDYATNPLIEMMLTQAR